MATVTTPPILDSTGQAIATSLESIEQSLRYGGKPAVATYEEATALQSHVTGDLIFMNDHFYKVTQAIAQGDSIVVGTNVSTDIGVSEGVFICVDGVPDA